MVSALRGRAYLNKGLMDEASKVSAFCHSCELRTSCELSNSWFHKGGN